MFKVIRISFSIILTMTSIEETEKKSQEELSTEKKAILDTFQDV